MGIVVSRWALFGIVHFHQLVPVVIGIDQIVYFYDRAGQILLPIALERQDVPVAVVGIMGTIGIRSGNGGAGQLVISIHQTVLVVVAIAIFAFNIIAAKVSDGGDIPAQSEEVVI